MAFTEKQPVEIIDNTSEGFSPGISYYTATVLARTGRNRYLVLYNTRLNRDGTRFMEFVDSDDVRPSYLRLFNLPIAVSDRVDAYVIHAWRVGTVIRVDHHRQIYYVKLDGGSGFVASCYLSHLRPHLGWMNGVWFTLGSWSRSNRASTSAQGGQPANDGNQASRLLEWPQVDQPSNQASTSLGGDQPGNHASTSAQEDQPGNQASTSPQRDQPEDDGSQAKRRRSE